METDWDWNDWEEWECAPQGKKNAGSEVTDHYSLQ